MRVPSDPRAVSNRILSALPTEDYRRLTDGAEMLVLGVRDYFYEAGQRIPFVYFITDGLGSVVTTMTDGTSIEVMVVGREGMVGLPALESESATVPTEAFMQVAGEGIKISSDVLRREFNRGGKLQSLLLGYMQFAMVQMAQNAACNRLHNNVSANLIIFWNDERASNARLFQLNMAAFLARRFVSNLFKNADELMPREWR